MMKNYLLFSFILVGYLTVSCNNSTSPLNQGIIGTWIDDGFEDNIRIFKRSNKLSNDQAGYIFNSDLSLVDRKNAGWCGTPPIAYKNYYGTWKWISQDTLRIYTEYWGGLDTFKVNIIDIDEEYLKLEYVY